METEIRKEYMQRAIALAGMGEGWCHPNPMVGAVIVKDGRIIGEGYHHRVGELHAERNALRSLTEPADGADLYVTLEPCCHWGRTPPCTDAIIEHHIGRVIIGSRDPNPKVHGKGVQILRGHGIAVVEDFMRDACDALNPVFFHYIQTKTPYVRMKYAMTADGRIATKTGASKWITGEKARERVQWLRAADMSIMAGIGTVLADDPLLTCRIPGQRQPLRIICDSHLRIPEASQLVETAADAPLLVVTGHLDTGELREKRERLTARGAEVLELPGEDGEVDLKALMQELGGREIDSLLLEGGGALNYSALKAGIVQEVDAFIAPKIFGGDAKAPVRGAGVSAVSDAFRLEMTDTEIIGEDLLVRYRVPDRKEDA